MLKDYLENDSSSRSSNDSLQTLEKRIGQVLHATGIDRKLVEISAATERSTAARKEAERVASELEATSKEIEGRVQSWLTEKNSEVEAFKNALKTSFATESAHHFWAKGKYDYHRSAAMRSLGFVLAYVVVLVVAAFFIGRLAIGHLGQKIFGCSICLGSWDNYSDDFRDLGWPAAHPHLDGSLKSS